MIPLRAGALAIFLAAFLLPALSCARDTESPGNGPPSVVATTGMIGDAARAVAGSRAEVRALMGEGVDPHLYKASPGDVRLLADADLILYNGLQLEGRMADVLVGMASSRPTVQVTDAIEESLLREPPEFEGHFDPHVWFDVRLWTLVVRRIERALSEVDPAGAEEYRANAAAHVAELEALDAWIREQAASVPADRRVLVTAHDAFGYFGDAYGFEVRGIQGISTDSEASVRDINELVDMLVVRRIPAVFVESTVPRKTIEALVEGARARGHELRIGGELHSDALGAAGTPAGTYLGMMRHNVEAIAGALRP